MARYDTITAAAINVIAANYSEVGRKPSMSALHDAIEARHPGAIERRRAARRKASFEQKFIGPVPAWAKRYVAKYAPGDVSSLQVRVSRTKTYSSGHCWYGDGRLVVTLSKPGSELVEQQATVLHEIAHARASWDGHGERFYDVWFEMLRAENLYRAMLSTGRFVGESSLKAAARRKRARG